MSHLHRMQIYLEEDQIRSLKLEAQKAHAAVSELIRKAIDRFLKASEQGVDWRKDPLSKAIGKITLSAADASEKHDQYLYGAKEKED